MTAGMLYGVGVGPGDPELMTLKPRRVIEDADVGPPGAGLAWYRGEFHHLHRGG